MLEQTILSGLLHNEDYMRRVVPFLSDDYFDDFSEKSVYKSIIGSCAIKVSDFRLLQRNQRIYLEYLILYQVKALHHKT